MKEIRYFYCPQIESRVLPPEEAEHAVRVLRLHQGDPIFVTDGKGNIYDAEIESIGKKSCSFIINGTTRPVPVWKGRICLGVAPTKMMSRMEMLAEKATEIGIDSISFLDCQFSERKVIKKDHIEKVVVSAVKQSHKAFMPEVNEMESFNQFIRHPFDGRKYIAHCYDEEELWPQGKDFLLDLLQEKPQTDDLVLIGPEGDFSVSEVKAAIQEGFRPVNLGKSRLRTETAALGAVFMMNLNNRIK